MCFWALSSVEGSFLSLSSETLRFLNEAPPETVLTLSKFYEGKVGNHLEAPVGGTIQDIQSVTTGWLAGAQV